MASSSKQRKLTIEISTDLTVDETLFDHLPDEVQLKIFKLLEIEDVMHCSQVSTRLRRICQDETIWKKVNLYERVVPTEFIAQILENGCKYINLRDAKIVGALQLSRKDYSVKYLNLHHCTADQGVLEKLISCCKSLQKLSLASLELDSDAVFFPHQELKTLDLNAFKGLDLELMTNILSCEKITDVSFRYNRRLSNDLVQYLVENLSSGVEKVSLGGIHCLTDEHVKTLVKRCKKIEELELGICKNITEDSLTSIVENCDQMVKLDVSFNIPSVQGRNPFLKVKSMPKLKVLNCQHPKRSSEETNFLRKFMPHLEINQVVFGGDLGIANPNDAIKPEDGIWDIFVKTIKLFPETQEGITRRKHNGKAWWSSLYQ